ncbi:MAG: hypothetical protein ABI632_00160 [Pseudolysinimonas sp.]
MSFIPAPLAGDPDTVANWGARFTNAAANLKKAADELNELTDGHTYISLAVDEVRLKALDARAATERVAVRYDGAGSALTIYAHDLRLAQARANRAINSFYNNDATVAKRHKQDLQDQCDADNGQTPGLVDQLLEAQRRVNNLVAGKAAALAEFNAAEADRDAAVMKAAAAIQDAGDDSGLNDNFFEAIGGAFQAGYEWAQEYLAPVLRAIHDIVAQISSIVSMIALVLTVLTIFLPFLAPLTALVNAIALTLTVIMLVCSLALLILGKGSLGEVLGDAVSFVTQKFGGKLAGAISEKIGAATGLNGVKSLFASNSTFLTTGAEQAGFLLSNGPSGMQLVEAGTEVLVDKGGEGIAEILGDATGVFEWPGADLAPSAAGPSWNAPPTPVIANVFSNTQDVSSAMQSFTSNNLSSSIPVMASC